MQHSERLLRVFLLADGRVRARSGRLHSATTAMFADLTWSRRSAKVAQSYLGRNAAISMCFRYSGPKRARAQVSAPF